MASAAGADPGRVGEIEQGGWSNPFFNDELATWQSEQLFASDAVLLGRMTYEGFAAAWPSIEETEGKFTVRMNRLPKMVFPVALGGRLAAQHPKLLPQDKDLQALGAVICVRCWHPTNTHRASRLQPADGRAGSRSSNRPTSGPAR